MVATARPLPRLQPRPMPLVRPDVTGRWAVPVALLLHVALVALLSMAWAASERRDDNPPMEVDLVAEVAPRSSAPVISAAPPAPKLGEVDELMPTPPVPPLPPVTPPPPPPPKTVAPRPTPIKTFAPIKAPAPKAPATKAAPVRTPPAKALPTKAPPTKAPPAKATAPTGRLDGITDGITRAPPTKAATAKAAPAAVSAAEVRKSIDVAIDGKILPHWRRNVPSGVDIDQLRVVLQIRLNPDGSVADVRQMGELSGKTDSNRPQHALFVERAIRSIRQASPFALPAEYYDQWRVWDVTFRAKGI